MTKDIQIEPDTTEASDGPRNAISYKYATKKSIAEGLLDLGLLMANASQLKSLLSLGPSQDYYYANLVLLAVSIALQIAVGVILMVLISQNERGVTGDKRMSRLNDVSVGLVFGIVVVNIFIAAFGIKLSE